MKPLRLDKIVHLLSNVMSIIKMIAGVEIKTESYVPPRFCFIPSKELHEIPLLNFVPRGSRIKIQIHAPFKWYRLQAAFHSIFSGSTDRLDSHTPRIDEICKHLNQISTHTSVNLISVIGGNYYLDLLGKLEMNSLILFDSNYLEIVKTSFVIDALSKREEEKVKNGGGAVDFQTEVENEISNYINVITRKNGVNIHFEQLHSSKWIHKGKSRYSFPILLEKEHYPNHAFSFSTENPAAYSKKLKRVLREDFWLDLPRINMNREFTVVFLSNVVEEEVSDLDVKMRIVNHSGLVIIRSNDDGLKQSINDKALDPHPYWVAILNSCLRVNGVYLKAFEILPQELRKLTDFNFQISNNNFDAFFCEEIGVLGEVAETDFYGVNALVTHILFGKIKVGEELKDRIESVRALFFRIPPNVTRIIVCEFHPDSKRFSHLRQEVGNLKTLLDIYQEILPDFLLNEIKESPGFLEERRNIFLVFDRSKLI